jgi:hypothetical protein
MALIIIIIIIIIIIAITIMLLEPRFKITSCLQFLLLKRSNRVLWRTIHV